MGTDKQFLVLENMEVAIGEQLADDRVFDPRRVISLSYNSCKTHVDGKAIKGYKVRKWLWRETGTQYHHYINTRREAEGKESGSSNADHVQELANYGTSH